jgi:hypothetical protein
MLGILKNENVRGATFVIFSLFSNIAKAALEDTVWTWFTKNESRLSCNGRLLLAPS